MNTKVSSSRFVLEIFSTWILLIPLSILNGILIARMLGPSGKGIFALVKIWSSYPIFLLTLGFPTGVLYYLSSEKYSAEHVTMTALIASLLSGVVLSAIILIIWKFQLVKGTFSALKKNEICFLIFITLNNSMISIMNRLVRGIGWFRMMNFMNLLSSISLFLLLVIFLIVLKKEINGALTALFFSQFITLLVIMREYTRKIRIELKIDMQFAIEAVKYGLKAYWANLANISTQRIDQFILSLYVKSSELGYYSVAATVSELPWLLVRSMNPVFFKKVSMYDFPQKIKLTNRILKVIVLVESFIYIFLFLFGGTIITLMYGKRFIFSGTLLKIYIPGALGYIVVSTIAKFFLSIEKPQIASYIQIVGGSVGVVLYYIFIKNFGVIGAAIASTLTYLFTASLSFYKYTATAAPQSKELFKFDKEDFLWIKSKIGEIVK